MRKKLFCMMLAVSLMIPSMPVMATEMQEEHEVVKESISEDVYGVENEETVEESETILDNEIVVEEQDTVVDNKLETEEKETVVDNEELDEEEESIIDNTEESTENEQTEKIVEESIEETVESVVEDTTEEVVEEDVEQNVKEIAEEAVIETAEETIEEPVLETIAENDEIIAAANSVAINATYFPDAVFRDYVKTNFDSNKDGYLSEEEIKNVQVVNVSSQEITSLKGIEYFTKLKSLNCYDTNISELDVSKCTMLNSLDCGNTNIGELDVSKCTMLYFLDCASTNISELDVRNCPGLSQLYCYDTKISELDVRNCWALSWLYCDSTKISELDVRNCRALLQLTCYNTDISELDVRNCSLLKVLWCDSTIISELDVSNCKNLEELKCVSYIGVDDGVLDLSAYDNFDPSRITSFVNVSINEKRLSVRDLSVLRSKTAYGWFDYDCGNGKSWRVFLTPMEERFYDVPVILGNWKFEAVKFITESGIMKGTGKHEFQPDAPLTRGMFVTMLYRMAGEPSVAYTGKYPDVPSGKWYSNAVMWASQNGIVGGYANGSFGVNDYITREQIAKMLMEYGKVQGYDVSQSASFSSFADAGIVSSWASNYMKWAVGSGMIGGSKKDGKSYLNPKGNATRVESATMLKRFMEKYN